jgi:hypothetical protein
MFITKDHVQESMGAILSGGGILMGHFPCTNANYADNLLIKPSHGEEAKIQFRH